MKILFFGNHTVGTTVLSVLNNFSKVVGVVAHPYDPEDGLVYESVFQKSIDLGITSIRGTPKDKAVIDYINNLNPDLIWVTDYRYILPEEIFTKPRFGSINLHPSLLPLYRGRASINWAIINQESKVGLSAHLIDKGVDSGNIIHQIEISINESDYIENVLNKYYPIYEDMTKKVLKDFFSLLKLSKPQNDLTNFKIYPARTWKDGQIDARNQDVSSVLALIRAVSKPYPGAFIFLNGQKLTIWKAEKLCLSGQSRNDIGRIFLDKDNMQLVLTNGIIKITEFNCDVSILELVNSNSFVDEFSTNL